MRPLDTKTAVQAVRYGATAIALHWLVALLLLCGAAMGLYMVGLELSPAKLKLYSWHKWVGVSIFLVALVRVLWRLTHPAPPPPASLPAWQQRAAWQTHALLYLLLFAIPLSGWLMSSALGVQVVYFGVLPLPDLVQKDKVLGEQLKLLHLSLNVTLLLLVALHVAAALKHHLLDRDDVLRRMLPARRPLR
jgi:cytochrome b561